MLRDRSLRQLLARVMALAYAVCLFMTADMRLQAKDISTAIGVGIDVSKYQGDVDWNAVAASGVQFAFVRVGSMKKGLDEKFVQNMIQANAAGIKTGVYVYSYATNAQEAAVEAVFVLGAIQNFVVNMPVVIDIEDSTQQALTKEQQSEIANIFCAIIEGAGYYPMVYTNTYWFTNRMGPVYYDKWVAQYAAACDIEDASFWQASSTGRIPGIQGNVDIDYQYKDLSADIIPYGFLYRKGNYFFYENYKMKTSSFVAYNGGIYYVNEVGCRVSGLYPVGGYVYYFNGDGLMQTGFQTIGGNTYYFDESGRMCLGWQTFGDVVLCFDPATGKMLTGWNVVGTDTYYFDIASGAKQVGWINLDGGVYYLGTEGALHVGLHAIGDGFYFFDAAGRLYTGFLSDGVNTFYFSPVDGTQARGWTVIDSGIYYFAQDTGIMYTGLQNIDNKTYLFDVSGKMQAGWQEIGGQYFYFGEDGAMVQ